MDINSLAKQVFAECVERGWWDDMNRNIHQTLMLVVTEIAEATEGVRRDRMDDHLPHRKMEEVELADTLIRLLDLAGRYKWNYGENPVTAHSLPDLFYRYKEYKMPMPEAAQHFALVSSVIGIANAAEVRELYTAERCTNNHYTMLVNGIRHIAELRGYDLDGAVMEKLAYNRTRLDHKREHRAHFDGKKF